MPAEWEPHAATWVAWPTCAEDWAGCLDRAEAEFVELVLALAGSELTHVLAPEEVCTRSTPESLAAHPRVRLHPLSTVEAFLRDTGPTFVVASDGSPLAIDWTFNAWGGRYEDSRRDDAVAGSVAALAGVPTLRSDLVTEGGALEVDGDGTLLAVEATLLDPARNPSATTPAATSTPWLASSLRAGSRASRTAGPGCARRATRGGARSRSWSFRRRRRSP
jgi:agmatine deiminase